MHTAIFDIGKTNKKFSVFDENLLEIHREYTTLPETVDEDGFAAEDLPLLTEWMRETLRKGMKPGQFRIRKLNFSTYGASFVHLDAKGNPLTPLYNYLKPFPERLADKFYDLAGGKENFCVRTASPALGMLNSGLQIYWLKEERPGVFARIRHSLHFPQYAACLFSGGAHSEFTSIGCHTGLWDFNADRYHAWLDQTGIGSLFPPTVPATHRKRAVVNGQEVEVGAGIHDSSAALLPYLLSSPDPFLLLSTGTWNITFNPFSRDLLTPAELNKDCLNYMQVDGTPVKASRLFFGNEFNLQTRLIGERFGKTESNYHYTITFNEALYQKWSADPQPYFRLESLQYPDKSIPAAPETHWNLFPTVEDAFHRLMIELMRLQKEAIRLAAGSTPVQKLFVDGGFSQSDLFINLLRKDFPTAELIVSPSPLGSSLGAAMAVNGEEVTRNYQFDLRRVSL
jgi:sugar (pentulose or hexulose) kinase